MHQLEVAAPRLQLEKLAQRDLVLVRGRLALAPQHAGAVGDRRIGYGAADRLGVGHRQRAAQQARLGRVCAVWSHLYLPSRLAERIDLLAIIRRWKRLLDPTQVRGV